MKKYTYVIIATNCDCCSDIIARHPTTYIYGPRCPDCKKTLSCMQWMVVDKIRAFGNSHALRLYREKQKKRQKDVYS